MKTKTIIWLITATSLIFISIAIFVVMMFNLNWNFANLTSLNHQTNKHEITEEFTSISINIDTADITFIKTDSDKCEVVCFEKEKQEHIVKVNDGKLIIESNDTRKWYEFVNVSFKNSKLSIYLPKTQYDNLSIKSSTGEVRIPNNFTFKNIDATLSTGDVNCSASATEKIKIATSTGDVNIFNANASTIEVSVSSGEIEINNVNCTGEIKINVSTGESELNNVRCESLISNGNTGDISLENVIASNKFYIIRSTGEVEFENSDALEIYVKTSSGDVEGSLLSSKIFIVNTNTGEKFVPNTITGGRCEITTSTGDIRIIIR